MPLRKENENDVNDEKESGSDEEPRYEFDDDILKLFTIKFLRADRFKKAFVKLSLKVVGILEEQMQLDFKDLLSCTDDTAPVLILLAKNDYSNKQQLASSSVANVLAKKAEVGPLWIYHHQASWPCIPKV